MDPWIETVTRRLGSPIFTTGDEVRFNCWRANCGLSGTRDTKYHLYVNPVSGKYFCQRCQRGGSLEYLAKILGIATPYGTLSMWTTLMNEYLYGSQESTESVKEVVNWPEEYREVHQLSQAYQYLLSRGISDQRIRHYKIGYGVGDLRNRIIIPDFNRDGDIVYWVGRSYGNVKHAAKYKNCTAPRDRQVFNLGRIEASGYLGLIGVTEGPISAIIAGYDCVSTYGKYVTGNQINRLVRLGSEKYVVAGDGDAIFEAMSLASRLYRRGCRVEFARFTGNEDPASVGPLEVRRRIRSAIRWDGFSALEVMV